MVRLGPRRIGCARQPYWSQSACLSILFFLLGRQGLSFFSNTTWRYIQPTLSSQWSASSGQLTHALVGLTAKMWPVINRKIVELNSFDEKLDRRLSTVEGEKSFDFFFFYLVPFFLLPFRVFLFFSFPLAISLVSLCYLNLNVSDLKLFFSSFSPSCFHRNTRQEMKIRQEQRKKRSLRNSDRPQQTKTEIKHRRR